MAFLTDLVTKITAAIDLKKLQKQVKKGFNFSKMGKNIVRSINGMITRINSYMSKPFAKHEKSLVENITGALKRVTTKTKKPVEGAFAGFDKLFKKSLAPSKMKKVGDAVKNVVGPKMIKGMKTIGGTIKGIFQSLGGGMGMFGMILQVLDSLGILKPFLTIINAIIKIIGGKVLGALMPLIMKFIDILLSEPFMALFDAIANMLIAILMPLMEVVLMVMEMIAPFLPMIAEMLMTIGEVIGELIEAIFKEEEMMYVIIGLMWALWAVGQAIIWIIRVIIIIVHVIRFVINIIIIAITFLVNIIMVMIDIIFFIVDFILDFLAIFGIGGGAPKKQYGGPVMETGIYHLEAGEEVETVGEGQEQHEEAMMVREETLESINDLVHFLRYEREE